MFPLLRRISLDNSFRFPQDDGFRHEVKYTLSPCEHYKFRDFCVGFMDFDKNAGDSGEYIVKSYYFDTVGYRDYTEKQDGIYARQKYRVRTYGDSGYYRLEKKIRKGTQNMKVSGEISKYNADLLIRGYTDIKTGNQVTDDIITQMHTKGYRSSVYIEYARQVLMIKELDIRVTFDKNISALYGSYGLEDAMPAPSPVFYNDETVLEIKYKEFLPEWLQRAVYLIIPSEYSVSKYAQSLRYILR